MDANLTDKAARLATEIATQARTLDDLNGLMKLMMKSALERMLDTELDVHLGRKRLPDSAVDSPAQVTLNPAAESPTKKGAKNRRSGHSQKSIQGDLGEIKLTTPEKTDKCCLKYRTPQSEVSEHSPNSPFFIRSGSGRGERTGNAGLSSILRSAGRLRTSSVSGAVFKRLSATLRSC